MDESQIAQQLTETAEGPLHVMDALERDAERSGTPDLEYAEAPESGVHEAPARPAATSDRGQDAYPDLSHVTTCKLPHMNLVLEGVCTHCAHCGHQLTDAVSIQRGIGPICSQRGYSEDPVEADEMQAMIDLSDFPELCEFLVSHYKPLGVRGLVNGLVRVASLNRPRGRGQSQGNARVHSACCDAVESLGHRKLAELLRAALVVVTIAPIEGAPGRVSVHVKKRDCPKDWWDQVRANLWDPSWVKRARHYSVPVHHPDDPSRKARSLVKGPDGKALTNRHALWALIRHNFPGLVVKTPEGTVKVK